VSECDREASKMRRPWPPRGCCAVEKKIITTSRKIICDSVTACSQIMLLRGIIAVCSESYMTNVHRVYVLWSENRFFVH
jgi:hypothetical protein